MFEKSTIIDLITRVIANQANNVVKKVTFCCGRCDFNVPASVIETDLVTVTYTDEYCEARKKDNDNPVICMHNKDIYRMHGELAHVLEELNRLAGTK